MKVSEVKLRMINKVNSLIDQYFSGNDLPDKFINSTMKIIVKQNVYKVDTIFELFADKNGEIDLHMMVDEYAKMIGDEGFVFDIKEYVANDFIKGMIPDKVLIIKKDDIISLLT